MIDATHRLTWRLASRCDGHLHRGECYHQPVTRSEVLLFAGRDWELVEEEKARFWAERKPHMTPGEALAAGEVLRQFVRRLRPDWPDEDDRASDLADHVRVGEALRAVSRDQSR